MMRPANAMRICWRSFGAAVLLAMSGCAMPDLSGGAAMRVEVEVYKGPLSKEPRAQWADLIGIFEEAETALIGINHVTETFAVNLGYVDLKSHLVDPEKNALADPNQKIVDDRTPSEIHVGTFYKAYRKKYRQWCEKEDPGGWISQIDFFDCHMLASLFADAKDLFHEVQRIRCLADAVNRQVVPVTPHSGTVLRNRCVDPNTQPTTPIELTADSEKNVRTVLVEITRVAAHFRAKSFRMAEAMVAGQTPDLKVRIAMTNLIAHVSDLGNQMQSQADALLKQLDGHDRRELALSAYLRDAEPTDFIQLYDWHDATAHANILSRPLIPGTQVSQVKAYERLFADHHWAKINTVHASGRGEVSMALIKDDIGNWNLKSFDNDPEELLKSYRDVATATLEQAKELAAGGQGKGVDLLVDLAGKVAFGEPATEPANIGGVSLESLHQSTDKKLTEVAAEFAKADEAKEQAYKDAKDAMPTGSEKPSAEQKAALQKARKDLIEHRSAALARFGEVLETYGEMIDLLTEAAADGRSHRP